MAANGIILFNSSFIGSSAGQAMFFDGGRAALILNANQYGPGVFFQLQGLGGAWIPVNASPYTGDQSTAYDLPSGQYRMISNQGSTVGLVAALTTVPYGV